MKPHSQTELRRVALLLALATILVSPLPASSTPQAGHGKGKSTGSGCPGGLDVSRSGQPSVPLAIAVGVFTGQRKGLIAPDEIILSTLPPGISRWLGQDVPTRLRGSVLVPVTVVTATRESVRAV